MSFDAPDAEDAAFYAHLTRQILMLMDEDDDETHATTTRKGSPEFRWRPESLISGKYVGWTSEGGRSLAVPGWMESLWTNNGAGTGVFIPRAVAAASKPRRKRNHRSRKNSNGTRIHSSPEQKIHG